MQKDSGERAWLFERIIVADWVYPRAGARQLTSRLGHRVNLIATIYRDYGYNIFIRDNVVIGPGCQLLDSGKIEIEGNTKIDARVTASTLGEPIDTRSPKGRKDTATAQKVFIGGNVYIGDGCVVIGGARTGDCTIVGAGSVVIQASIHCFSFEEDLWGQSISPDASERHRKKILIVHKISQQTALSLAIRRKLDR